MLCDLLKTDKDNKNIGNYIQYVDGDCSVLTFYGLFYSMAETT